MSPRPSEIISSIALVVLSVCAVLITVSALRRNAPPDEQSPLGRQIDNWTEFAGGGIALGAADAPVTIVQFSDYQCLYCARLQHYIDTLHARYPGTLRVVYRNFPLTRVHLAALDAAVAAECANELGAFESVHRALYRSADSLGQLDWTRFAPSGHEAEFTACIGAAPARARVEADIDLGRRLGVTRTPTILLNTLLLEGLPPLALLDSIVQKALAEPHG